MLALINTNQNTELFLPSGETVSIPDEVLNAFDSSNEFELSIRWAYKAGLIEHQDYLEARDSIRGNDSIRMAL